MSSTARFAPSGVRPGPAPRDATNPVGLSWLVTVRWTTLLAGSGALVAGRSGLGASTPIFSGLLVLGVVAASNIWLAWRARRGPAPTRAVAGGLVCLDVLALSWLLLGSGGVLNPVSVFYLVLIVLAALVLGQTWTWIVTTLSVVAFGAMFLARTEELRAAAMMHPEIGLHVQGMWLAFAATALLVGLLVARLAVAVARRDRALDQLRSDAARSARLAGLATLAAGAAHELSTPLSTIAVAAREVEHALDASQADADLRDDARLIRSEIDRCRRILDDLAGRSNAPRGDDIREVPLSAVAAAIVEGLSPTERARVTIAAADHAVRWPLGAIAQAAANLVRNALQASDTRTTVSLELAQAGRATTVTVVDRGRGMTADEAAHAGEPFYTTKPQGAGMGLGLFVARSTVEQLGGSLEIRSASGRGTTAIINLPSDVVASGAESS